MRVAAIVVAAGTGERFGARKQFVDLEGRCAAARAVATARCVATRVVLVVPADAVDEHHGADLAVPGGATRAASVRAGLAALPADVAIVIVHDAARPLATEALFHAVADAVTGEVAGAVPGLAVVDTVKRVDSNGAVVETLVRDELVAVQTPQAFAAAVLRRAHDGDPEGTDDASLVEAIGGRVVVVPGEPTNLKLTTSADLDAARAVLASR